MRCCDGIPNRKACAELAILVTSKTGPQPAPFPAVVHDELMISAELGDGTLLIQVRTPTWLLAVVICDGGGAVPSGNTVEEEPLDLAGSSRNCNRS